MWIYCQFFPRCCYCYFDKCENLEQCCEVVEKAEKRARENDFDIKCRLMFSFYVLHNWSAIKSMCQFNILFVCVCLTTNNMYYIQDTTYEIQKFKSSNNCNLNVPKRKSYKIQFNLFRVCYSCCCFSTGISILCAQFYASMALTWHQCNVAHLVHLITNILDLHFRYCGNFWVKTLIDTHTRAHGTSFV